MANSKDGKQELSILTTLINMTSQPDAYYIIWKYAPELIADNNNLDSFEKLQKRYSFFEKRTETGLEKTLYKEANQKAIKYLMQRLDKKRDIELLNKYFHLAMNGDTHALKAYMDFKKTVLSDGGTDELSQIIKNAAISSDDNYEMKF